MSDACVHTTAPDVLEPGSLLRAPGQAAVTRGGDVHVARAGCRRQTRSEIADCRVERRRIQLARHLAQIARIIEQRHPGHRRRELLDLGVAVGVIAARPCLFRRERVLGRGIHHGLEHGDRGIARDLASHERIERIELRFLVDDIGAVIVEREPLNREPATEHRHDFGALRTARVADDEAFFTNRPQRVVGG